MEKEVKEITEVTGITEIKKATATEVTEIPNKTEIKCFIVHGVVPELTRGMAFRIEKHYATKGKKVLKCPYCGKDFEVVDSGAKVELRCFKKKSEALRHNIIACRICRNPVGIIYASA